MIIKRNERKRARRIIISLSRGISIRGSRASPRPSASLHFLPPPLPHSFCPPFIPSTPRPLSASTEPAAPLVAPTNGGSFCFTFILISDDPRDQSDAIFRFEISRKFSLRTNIFGVTRKIMSNSIFTLFESWWNKIDKNNLVFIFNIAFLIYLLSTTTSSLESLEREFFVRSL